MQKAPSFLIRPKYSEKPVWRQWPVCIKAGREVCAVNLLSPRPSPSSPAHPPPRHHAATSGRTAAAATGRRRAGLGGHGRRHVRPRVALGRPPGRRPQAPPRARRSPSPRSQASSRGQGPSPCRPTTTATTTTTTTTTTRRTCFCSRRFLFPCDCFKTCSPCPTCPNGGETAVRGVLVFPRRGGLCRKGAV